MKLQKSLILTTLSIILFAFVSCSSKKADDKNLSDDLGFEEEISLTQENVSDEELLGGGSLDSGEEDLSLEDEFADSSTSESIGDFDEQLSENQTTLTKNNLDDDFESEFLSVNEVEEAAEPLINEQSSDELLALSGSDPNSMAVESDVEEFSGEAILSEPETIVLGASSTPSTTYSNTSSYTQPRSYQKPYRKSQTPTLRSEAWMKGDALLNRYYFVRRGDTPSTVAQLIYGTEDFAPELQRWNPHSWKAGKILYYQSPLNPTDRSMSSLYQESNSQADTYTVKRGEWLSVIAKKTLGSPSQWTELATLNSLSRPDSLKRGQKLIFYPYLSAISTQSQKVAKEEPVKEKPPTQEKRREATPQDVANNTQTSTKSQKVQDPPTSSSNSQEQNTAPTDVKTDLSSNELPLETPEPIIKKPEWKQRDRPQFKPKKRRQPIVQSPVDKYMTLIKQNLFTFAMGGLLLLLLLALMTVNRRKKQVQIDDTDFFDEEDTLEALAARKRKKR